MSDNAKGTDTTDTIASEHNPEYWDRKIAKAFDKAFPPDPPAE